jgi:hypothetical protein
MLNLEEKLEIKIDDVRKELRLSYTAETDRMVYDICDFSGKILKTGRLDSKTVVIDMNGLPKDRYILLILDGDKVFSKQFLLA